GVAGCKLCTSRAGRGLTGTMYEGWPARLNRRVFSAGHRGARSRVPSLDRMKRLNLSSPGGMWSLTSNLDRSGSQPHPDHMLIEVAAFPELGQKSLLHGVFVDCTDPRTYQET